MNKDTDFSPQQSLQLIEGMINKAQNRFSENGHLYLLWGWAVFFCGLLQFILLHFFNYQQHYYVWAITWLLAIYQAFYLSRKKKTAVVKTYYDDIIGYIWISFVVLMFLIGFLLNRLGGGMAGKSYMLINPFILALYGMPVFLSGIILRYKPLQLGGIGCWVLAFISGIITPHILYNFQLLFIPAAMLIAWIIPGYMMRNKFKQTN